MNIKTVPELVAALGGNVSFARMIGVGASTGSEMKRRGRIPPEYWQKLVRGAQAIGLRQITADLLMELHDRSQPTGPQAGLAEPDVALFEAPSEEAAGRDQAKAQGHFTRFRHLRRPNFQTGEEIEDHIRALREEWSHR